MKLSVENFARIGSAEILAGGITVIAGENNTGKSTIGKILFSLFNSMNDIQNRILEQRKIEVQKVCEDIINSYDRRVISRVIPRRMAAEIIEIYNLEIDENEKYKIIEQEWEERIARYTDEISAKEIIHLIIQKVKEILSVSEENILLEVFTRYFNNMFNNQINSLIQKESEAKLELEIKDKKIHLSFKNDKCIEFNTEILFANKAIFIDNPFIINKLGSYERLDVTDNFLKNLIEENENRDIMDGIIQSVLAKEKLEEINKVVQEVVGGDILRKEDGKYYLLQDNFKEPVSINNLSAGLKSFVLIKMLLEKGILKEKDVLILDEPEIHLHPKWQVVYAQLIVLLQKQFDLSIVVTTHSPYFLDAVDLYSIKYGLDKKVNFYLSSMDNDSISMELVTGQIDKIYKKMATPIQALDTLRYELNNN